MNDLKNVIANCRKTLVKMAYGLLDDDNEIQEIVQETIMYLYTMNQDTLKKIYDKDGVTGILKYSGVVMRRAVHSKRSNYYYKYNKYYEKIDTNYNLISKDKKTKDIENLPNYDYNITWTYLEKIDTELDNMYWYDAELFKLYYYENNTLDSLAEKTGISRNSIHTTISKVRKQLKENLNE